MRTTIRGAPRSGHSPVLGAVMLAVALAWSVAAGAAPADGAPVATAGSEQELREAIQAAGDSTTVGLTADIALTGTLDIADGKDVTLTGDHRLTAADDGAYTAGKDAATKAVVVVEQGGSLTLGGSVILDGTGFSKVTAHGVRAATVNGALTIDGGSVANFSGTADGDALVLVDGEKAELDLVSGSIENNDVAGLDGAIVWTQRGARFAMSGGSVSDNTNWPGSADSSGWTQGSAIVRVGVGSFPQMFDGKNEDAGSTFDFTGGDISGNKAAYATVLVGETYAIVQDAAEAGSAYADMIEVRFAHAASMTMGGSARIEGNTAAYMGGGVAVYGPGELTMSGGTVSGNHAQFGGGVATCDGYVFGDLENRFSRGDDKNGNVSLSDWTRENPARFTMSGGSISGNSADQGSDNQVGGGVYVSSDTVTLAGGSISDNTAGWLGGGIYVASLPYTVHLSDALVTGNTAEVLGGGMWLCPMGGASTQVKNGADIVNNTSKGAGDDVVSLAKDREGGDTGASLSLLNRMLGNWMVDWYQDGAVSKAAGVLGVADTGAARYADQSRDERAQVGGIVLDSKDDIALKAVASEEGVAAAKAAAKLTISGNSAQRGGGIGANGNVVFGEKPIDYETIDVTVDVTWENGSATRPGFVWVNLYDQDGNQIDRREVTAGDG